MLNCYFTINDKIKGRYSHITLSQLSLDATFSLVSSYHKKPQIT